MANIVLATCQFPVDKDCEQNLKYVTRQIKLAKAKGAHLVHFSETSLSGYLGVEIKSLSQVNWKTVTSCMHQVMALAKQHGLWIVIGCNHRLSGRHKPHNSLYVISNQGRIVNRYDKMFCTGINTKANDLRYYSPGESFVTFKVRNVKCGLLICHDFRYPELFRKYKQLGVELMLVSFHNARMNMEQRDKYIVYVTTTIQAAAGSNYFAISANNSSSKYAWPSFVVNAEGLIISRARSHRPEVMINMIDTKEKLYDASSGWRNRCMKGVFHSGTLVRDPRSQNRETL